MKKLVSLLKATMSQDMNLFKIKTNQKTRVGKVVFPLLIALLIMISIGGYAGVLAQSLAQNHLTYVVLTFFMLVTCIFTLIEGIYKSQGILFEAKDNDLLFALPISKTKIFFTRVFKMLSFQFLFNSLFMIPVIIVYAMYEPTNLQFYLLSFIMLLLLPVLPTILACIIGYGIKLASAKLKARNAVQVILTFIVLLVVFYFSFSMQTMIANLTQNATAINQTITKLYYPIGVYNRLIQNFAWYDFLALLGVTIVPMVVFVWIASKYYFKIVSKLAEKGKSKKVDKAGMQINFKPKAPFAALVR